jgi:hypothetical protein
VPDPSKGNDSSKSENTEVNAVPSGSAQDITPKQALKDARAKLMDADGNPTPHYQAYLKYQDEYQSKVQALHKAYAAALTNPMKLQTWPIDGVSYQNDVDEAMQRWVSLGFKQEIENALTTLAAQGANSRDNRAAEHPD